MLIPSLTPEGQANQDLVNLRRGVASLATAVAALGGAGGSTDWDAINGKPETATRWPAFSEVTGELPWSRLSPTDRPVYTTRWPSVFEVFGLGAIPQGSMIYADPADTVTLLPIGVDGSFLRTSGGLPAWSAWTTPSSLASGDLPYATGTDALGALAHPAAAGRALETTMGGIQWTAALTQITDHNNDTTGVHGIVDTSDLALVSLLTTDFGYSIPITNISPDQSSRVLLWDSGGGWAGASFGASGTVLVGQGTTTNPAFAQIFDAQIAPAAAVAWSKISKTGSSLADLTTKNAGALDSGNLASARLPTGSVSWSATSFTLTPSSGRLIVNTSAGQDIFEGQQGGNRALLITGTGRFNWADAAGGAADTRLYRSAASTLTLDNAAAGAGNLSILGTLGVTGKLRADGQLFMDASHRDKISVLEDRLGLSNMYGLGTEASTLYFKSPGIYRWYVNVNADAGASDKMELTSSVLTVGVNLAHTGTTLGFYGITPVARPAALTQTYSTTSTTHANFTSADVGAFTGGSVGFLDAAERDNVRTQFNLLRADVANIKQFVNQVVDYFQLNGLLQ